jgi:hypothetical protein
MNKKGMKSTIWIPFWDQKISKSLSSNIKMTPPGNNSSPESIF